MPAIGIGVMAIATEIGVSTLVGGMMFASGALSFVGSVTGNKTLSMLGTVAGIGAGVAGGWQSLAGDGGGALAESTSEAYINAGGMGGGVADAAAAAPVAGMSDSAVEAAIYSQPVTDYASSALATQNALVDAGMQGGTGMIGQLANGSSVLDANFNSILGVDGSAMNIGANGPLGVDATAAPSAASTPSVPGATDAPTPTVAGATPEPSVSLAPKVEAPMPERMPYQDTPDSVGSAKFAKPEKGLIDTAMEKINGVGEWMQKNDKLVSATGKIMERLDPSDLEEAQKKYIEAKANNDDAQAEFYRAKIAEMNRLAANANARGANALGNGNAISANGSAYSNNPTRPGNALSFGKA